MPAVSRSQQKLFGMAYAYLKGEFPDASKEVKDLAKSLKKKKKVVKDFASTKHKGLPEHVKKKKKKKSKKKSDLIIYFTKLANYLDSQDLIKEADLTDQIIQKLANDLISGGKADYIPDTFFDPKEMELGLPEEMEEHTTDPEIAKEIVEDHLMTDPHYYSKEAELINLLSLKN